MFTQTACSPQTITKNLEYCVLEHILIVSSVSPNAAAEAGTKEENVDEKRFLTRKAKKQWQLPWRRKGQTETSTERAHKQDWQGQRASATEDTAEPVTGGERTTLKMIGVVGNAFTTDLNLLLKSFN